MTARAMSLRKAGALGIALLVAAVPAAAQEPDGAADYAPAQHMVEPDLSGWRLDGWFDALFRYRLQAERDQDDADLLLSGFVAGGLNDADGRELGSFQIDGLVTADLDGFPGARGAFSGLQETYNSRVHGFLYSAWVETSSLLDRVSLRGGRQEILREDALFFDGLSAIWRPAGEWSLTAYGGVPVHFYESNRSGDALAGVGAEWLALPGLRLGLDEIYLADEQRWFGEEATAHNNLTLLSAHWLAASALLVRGTASWVGAQDRRQTLSAAWSDPQADWRAQVRVQRQNDYGEIVATEISPLAAVLGDVAPHWYGLAELYRRFGRFEAGVGVAARALEQDADESVYNREYGRYFASMSLDQFPLPDADLGARVDVWDADDDDLTAFGVFAGWDWQEDARLEVGTDHALYRFDEASGSENLDDRQYYVRAEVPVLEQTQLRVRYALDHSQFGNDHLFELGLAVEF